MVAPIPEEVGARGSTIGSGIGAEIYVFENDLDFQIERRIQKMISYNWMN